MKLHSMYRIWIIMAVLALAILACIFETGIQPVPTQVSQAQPTPISQNQDPTQVPEGQPEPIFQNPEPSVTRADLIRATVQIYALFNENGKLTPKYSGSGTIISSTGMILTNAHVASPASQGEPDMEPDALAIAVIDQEDQPPVFSYYAKVKAVDGYLDLAVIQITSTLDGTNVDPNSLNLPFVNLGNSDDIHVGDPIDVIGFPAIGGDTITFTTGSVSGFTPEEGLGDRAWIKTDAAISGGNSGGLGASAAGLIIGVPTRLGKGTGSNFVDCRKIADTNGDGVIDEKDTCVPAGEFLNALRSINLALPLIKAVEAGQTYVPLQGVPAQAPAPTQPSPQPSPSGNESFSAITWMAATDSEGKCQLQGQVTAYPSGTTVMVAAWSFSGMTDGEPWFEEWKLDGSVVYTNQDSWNYGPEGEFSTCLTSGSTSFSDGNYQISLYAGTNDTLLTQSGVVVGEGTNGPSQPSNQGVVTIFGQVLDADSNNPLPGTKIYALNPGITFDQWTANNYADTDIFSIAKTDNQGNYALPDRLALDVGYTFVIFMEGYKIKFGDNLVWTSQDPLNYRWDFTLSK